MSKLRSHFGLGLIACLSTQLAEASQDRSQMTLVQNGFYAAGVGEIWLDHGEIWNESYTALRLRAGFQLVRWGEFSMTLGYSKTGFYQALRQSDSDGNKIEVDYHGPSLEAVIFPSKPLNLIVGGLINARGHSRAEIPISAVPAEMLAEYSANQVAIGDDNRVRSWLNVREYHVALSYEVWHRLHLILGGGMRTITHRYQVQNCNSVTATCLDRWPEDQRLKLVDENPFFFFGIRGSHI